MKRMYSNKELVALLRITRQALEYIAARENWAYEKIKGKRGGGKLWLVHSMPKETQQKIANALANAYAAEAHSKRHAQPVNTGGKESRCHSFNGIPEHGQRIAEAKMFVRNYALNLHEGTDEALSNVLFEVARQFKERTPHFPDWVYQNLRGASRSTIHNWIKQLDQGGVQRLAKQHEKRRPRNIIENTPVLNDFVLGMLYEFPHTSAAQIERGLVARFGLEGTTPDPSIKLPCLRRIQAWLKVWKGNNAQLLLAHVDPDASRSKDKLAFGDAAAHIYYLNQEWQSDGTLCELMLNDNRRHTLNLTIDVYSRRLRFHVSRTSSAAAVASGVRKAMLDWGMPDNWKTDNGSDYKNAHIDRVMGSLRINHELCPPFSPEKKPFVERAFKSFLRSHVEVMQGYLGHNVAERKAIESRKSFANRLYKKLKTPGEEVCLNISPEELQRVCDEWAEYVYGNEVHGGLNGMTPNQKAAAYDKPVQRISDERALDVLLLPVPGKKGIRTVGKKGLCITTKICGLKFPGHYFSLDAAALKGQRVLVRFDDTCLGSVIMMHPETSEYLGKAENPSLLGWTQDDVRNMAVASERKRKAIVVAEKKAWREAAKRADVINIGNEIIATAKRRYPKATPLHEAIVYTTPALEQAARVRTGDFTYPTVEEHARGMADLERMLAPEEVKGFVVPQDIGAKLKLWHALYDRKAAGEILEADAQRWFVSFAQDETCKAYCRLHGLDFSLAVNG